MPGPDAVVIGAGPNGLAAAATLAAAGRSVLVLEAEESIGGGSRSAELTIPGFVHDVCSTIHPLAAASPVFRQHRLEEQGLEWVHSPALLAHPLDDGSVALLERSPDATAEGLGRDASSYRRLMEPLVARRAPLVEELLGRFRVPRHPFALARFGFRGIRSLSGLARRFRDDRSRALLAGMGAHSTLPLDTVATGAVALVLCLLGHAVGWPVARGGSRAIIDALATRLSALGVEIVTDRRVSALGDVPKTPLTLFDVTPRQLARIAGDRLPTGYRRRLHRFRHGPGVFKVDWALDGPIPWKGEDCARAATVHLGGTLEEIRASEAAAWAGEVAERPFVLLAQQTLFDPTRAPRGKHTAWAYCHVPNGSDVDMTERIESQVERFAPGFRDLVLARSAMPPAEMERHNANYLGGDITGGVLDLRQVFARPTLRPVPYATPLEGVYLCSASTPPGPGVHGMCGYFAARAALRRSR